MNKLYHKNTLGYHVLSHDNNYPLNILKLSNPTGLTSLSIVILYFEAVQTINLVLEHLLKSVNKIKKQVDKTWDVEVILIDDGSTTYTAKETIHPDYLSQIKVVRHAVNRGRCIARNTGIRSARKELLLFLDADILVNETILLNHMRIHNDIRKYDDNAISVSLFNFVQKDILDRTKDLSVLFKKTNDFRDDCTYQEKWIGCEEDKEFANQRFRIMKDTHYLQKWPLSGSVGPWIMTNMVLGGAFMVDRKLAQLVNGCDYLFVEYGFEETSLATKLIVYCGSYIIPETSAYPIHIICEQGEKNRPEKNTLFRKAHDLYFNKFLKRKINENVIFDTD